ncbi:MAG: DJ-1/PfpI family protein [Sulfurospirillaceae bacterium]|nr:DJ-1/PfpI family protein [Sulfurospirillaceae bacterium]MDD2826672.1 DJ-1/PfpI family protein [Sulfurospirillaceae bacterium]
MPKVIIPIATGFEEIEAITVVDILRRAGIEVVMASLRDEHVMGAHGIEITTNAFLDNCNADAFDMIVLPGGLPGATNLAADLRVQTMLQAFDARHKPIAAICAAPLALKTAGVLKNSYTCYPSFEVTIDHQGYKSDVDVVRDANITTSKGPRTAMVFAIALVEILLSKEASEKLQKDLLLTA